MQSIYFLSKYSNGENMGDFTDSVDIEFSCTCVYTLHIFIKCTISVCYVVVHTMQTRRRRMLHTLVYTVIVLLCMSLNTHPLRSGCVFSDIHNNNAVYALCVHDPYSCVQCIECYVWLQVYARCGCVHTVQCSV